MIRRLLLVATLAWGLLAGLLAGSTGPASASPVCDTNGSHCHYVTIQGTGSTWSQNIVMQWIADVNANGMKVVYTGGGSSKGRKDFAQSTVDYAISEIPYQGVDEQGNADTSNGRKYAYLPIVAGGTAFTYQLKVGSTMVRNLRLSGETLAKIFTNQITNWNDPAITRDNNGHAFPSLPITPVVRSDGSGTTAQFTSWMNAEYPSVWQGFSGLKGLTSYYPRKGRAVAQAGSDQVMNYIASSAGNGTIGYVEYSYPINTTAPDKKPYPVVKVLNRAGFFVEPTQYNTAVALTAAKIRTNVPETDPSYLTQDLSGVYVNKDKRAYPISSYSYMIIPVGASDSQMTTAKRQTLADFLFYSLCTGQTKAGPYGYSPLPLNLVKAGFDQISRLKDADPDVVINGRDVTKCNNPTFVAGNLAANHLAQIAPFPQPCDQVGQGPCGSVTATGASSGGGTTTGTRAGGGRTTASGTTAGTTAGGAGAPVAGGGGTTVGGGAAPDPGSVAVDPTTGQAVSTTATGGGGGEVYANATELVSARRRDQLPFGLLAAVELLALVVVPGLLVGWLRRRRATGASTGASAGASAGAR